MKPWMSDYEIAESYTHAANPAKQIKVLVELNACTKADIEAALLRRGIKLPTPKAHKLKGVKKKYWTVAELVELLCLQESGLSKPALAKHFGRTETAVRNILTKMNPEVVSVPPRNIAKALELYKQEKGAVL